MTEQQKKNKELCKKYFFLIPLEEIDESDMNRFDFSYTLLDSAQIPVGWEGFMMDFCDELLEALNKEEENKRYSFVILQMKEKFGMLRVYHNWTTPAIDAVIKKYEDISAKTCSICGAPAVYRTTDYILPFCDSCIHEVERHPFEAIEE